MSRILVVYHTFSGNTEKLANAFADGARAVTGSDVVVKKVTDVTPDDVQKADGLAFGTPNTFGGMSGAMREFFDRMWPLHEQTAGRPAAIFTTENEGQTGAIDEIRKFFGFYKLKEVAGGLTVSAPVDDNTDMCYELGRTLAKTVQM